MQTYVFGGMGESWGPSTKIGKHSLALLIEFPIKQYISISIFLWMGRGGAR